MTNPQRIHPVFGALSSDADAATGSVGATVVAREVQATENRAVTQTLPPAVVAVKQTLPQTVMAQQWLLGKCKQQQIEQIEQKRTTSNDRTTTIERKIERCRER